VKDVAPGAHQQLILVRVFVRELKVAARNILKRLGGEKVLIQLQSHALGQGFPQRLFVSEALVNGGSRGASFSSDSAKCKAGLAARAPQFLRGLQDSFL
jgi:hypothetical protein